MSVESTRLHYVPKLADFGIFRPLESQDIYNYIFFLLVHLCVHTLAYW